jgi:quercetin dioxygenase-like cupin family protein
MADNWHVGNANDDEGTRGWLLGHFIDPAESVRSTGALEVKWGVHPAGQQRPEWSVDERRSTLVLLVSGRFRVDLTVGTVLLERQGDYAVWGPGIDHWWQAEEDSIVVTVRWPSLSDS